MVIPLAFMRIQVRYALRSEISHISMTQASGILPSTEESVCQFHLVAYKNQLSFPTHIPVAEPERFVHIE